MIGVVHFLSAILVLPVKSRLRRFVDGILIRLRFTWIGIIHLDIKTWKCINIQYFLHKVPYFHEIASSSSTERRFLRQRRILQSMEIRLIDPGLTMFESDPHRECIANLRYSAPEAMLSLKSSFSRDIWSIVCTLVEFATDKVHFRSAQHTKAEYLAVIEGFTGSIIEDWECRAIDGEYRGRFRMLRRSPLHLHRDNMRGTKYIDVSDY